MNLYRVNIIYCPKCGWLLRSAWVAQELLTTFVDELDSVTLSPSKVGGVFDIFLNEKLVFSRCQTKKFPEPKELKQLIRDLIAPNKNLGHSDKK